MRFRSFLIAIAACSGMAMFSVGFAQVKAPDKAAPAAAPPGATGNAALQPVGTLAQVMRGIMLPNSNVVFFAQDTNPATVKPAADPSAATDPLSDTYGGWTAVENSAIALAEAANLLMIPGRLCSNGRPVPMNNPDWAQLVQGLRAAGMVAYQAAQSKNQDKIVDASGTLTTACANCHNKYRDRPGGVAARCME